MISTEFPRSRAEECFGGILADEMGLGKVNIYFIKFLLFKKNYY